MIRCIVTLHGIDKTEKMVSMERDSARIRPEEKSCERKDRPVIC